MPQLLALIGGYWSVHTRWTPNGEAHAVLNKYPKLIGPRGEALRVLLYLFERDAAIRHLSAG